MSMSRWYLTHGMMKIRIFRKFSHGPVIRLGQGPSLHICPLILLFVSKLSQKSVFVIVITLCHKGHNLDRKSQMLHLNPITNLKIWIEYIQYRKLGTRAGGRPM